MGIPDRVYNLAKAQLDKAKLRWEEIDDKAQQELDEFMSKYQDNNGVSAWDRALGKIGTAQAARELNSTSAASSAPVISETDAQSDLDALQHKLATEQAVVNRNPPSHTLPDPQFSNDALIGAYKILGVEPGADWLTVQKAYQRLRERAAPDRFAEGTPERETALSIQRRVESAFIMLSNVLAPSSDRFDKLEI